MKAYFAGGCFWCMEKPYHLMDGVINVESGYCGGQEQDPTYNEVKEQKTAHRETVSIEFDETRITYDELLEAYFDNIDPFDDGGQFIDRGHSYTCAVYYVNEEQKRKAGDMISRLERDHGRKVAVALEEYIHFWRAEEYHQDYAGKNPEEYEKEYEGSGRKAYFEKQKTGSKDN